MLRYLSVCILALFCFALGGVYADTVVDAYISAIEAKHTALSSQEQSKYIKKTFALLSLQALRFSHDTQQLAIITPLQDYLLNKINSLQKQSFVEQATSLVSTSTQISNVDMEKVRSAWLQRHNQERHDLGLEPLAYHFALESTATTWANYLGTIRAATHKRTSSDGYYSYSSIKQRLLNQGIIFAHQEQYGQSLFTENLGWNVYSCKKTDCTEDFIAAVKKSRDFFMSEKGRSYKPHYNAIVGDYTNIGLGIAISGTRYYLVSHYTQDLQ